MSPQNKLLATLVVSYLSILSTVISIYLIFNIRTILGDSNLYLGTLLIVNIFYSVYNVIFIFKKNKSTEDWKLTLLFNIIFCVISGLSVRMLGFIFINNYGIDLSPYFIKNEIGIAYGFNYNIFNIDFHFYPYDTNKYGGFKIELNLIMIIIGIILFRYLKKIRIDQ